MVQGDIPYLDESTVKKYELWDSQQLGDLTGVYVDDQEIRILHPLAANTRRSVVSAAGRRMTSSRDADWSEVFPGLVSDIATCKRNSIGSLSTSMRGIAAGGAAPRMGSAGGKTRGTSAGEAAPRMGNRKFPIGFGLMDSTVPNPVGVYAQQAMNNADVDDSSVHGSNTDAAEVQNMTLRMELSTAQQQLNSERGERGEHDAAAVTLIRNFESDRDRLQNIERQAEAQYHADRAPARQLAEERDSERVATLQLAAELEAAERHERLTHEQLIARDRGPASSKEPSMRCASICSTRTEYAEHCETSFRASEHLSSLSTAKHPAARKRLLDCRSF